jgi:hypothetical protein
VKVGDLVRFRGCIGIITCVFGGSAGRTVEVTWSLGDVENMYRRLLEVISETR